VLVAGGCFAPEALAVVELTMREETTPPADFGLIDQQVYGTAGLVFLCSHEERSLASRRITSPRLAWASKRCRW
jgi:hypothetical protein